MILFNMICMIIYGGMRCMYLYYIYIYIYIYVCLETARWVTPYDTDQGWLICISLLWRHNDHDSVSNHQPHGCLLNRLFRRRSKKTSKLRVTGLCVRNSPGPVNSPHKWPVTRKMFPFDDVIMCFRHVSVIQYVMEIFAKKPDKTA